MHENKFEQQVREKMEQLGFDPPDDVWTNVDKEINKDKERRRPIFWLLFFSGLLLAGGGYYFSMNKNAVNPIAANKHQKEGYKDPYKREINKTGEKTNRINEENEEKGRLQQDNVLRGVLNEKRVKESIVIHSGKTKIRLDATISIEKGEDKNPEKYAAADKREELIAQNNVQNNSDNNPNNGNKNGIDSSGGKKINTVVENKTSTKDSVSGNKIAKNKNQKSKSSSWKIGFTASTGISSINKNLFNSANQSNSSYNYTAASTGAPNPGSPGPVYTSSKITPGFSFGAGAFINRHFSDRVSFSAGINYHFYSTKIQIGSFVNSSLSVNSGPGQITYINSYYQNRNDQTYTNQYHFIELPVSINFQLNKSRQTPVILEGGFSLAYLLGSNALHYDPLTNAYYRNNQLFNKLQLNTSTAIMIGFTVHNAVLQLGPQVQYGLTGLLKTNAGIPQHILCYGLKISFVPGKK